MTDFKVFSAQVLISPDDVEVASHIFELVSQGAISAVMKSYNTDDGFEFLVYIKADTSQDAKERLVRHGINGPGVVIRS